MAGNQIDRILEILRDDHGRTVVDIGYEPATRVDLWARDESGRSHADFDHYLQECSECQRVWVEAILEAMSPAPRARA
jgi:hypothetical protein